MKLFTRAAGLTSKGKYRSYSLLNRSIKKAFLLLCFIVTGFYGSAAVVTITNGQNISSSTLANNDIIIIEKGGTLNSNTTRTFTSITASAAGAGTVATVSGTSALTVSGNIIIEAGATLVVGATATNFVCQGTLTTTGTGTATLTGSISTAAVGANTIHLTATSPIAIAGTNAINISGNVQVASGETLAITPVVTAGTFSTNNVTGTATISGTGLSITGAITINGANNNPTTVAVASGAVVTCSSVVAGSGNANTSYNISVTGTFKYSGANLNALDALTCAATSTVEYNGGSAQAIFDAVSPGYGNIILTGNSTKTAGGGLDIQGNLTINSTATFAAGTSLTHNIQGNWINDGTFSFTTGSTINFNGNNILQTVSGASTTTFGAITVAKTSLANTLEVTSAMGLNAGGLTLTSGTFKLSGTGAITNTFFGSTSYTIASGSGFWLNNANAVVTGQTGSPTLGGLLRVSAGSYNIGTATGNTITYNTGAALTIEGGAVNIAGRLCPTTAATSTITYNQSGGTLTVVTQGSASTTLAGFDIGATASSFTMSGGTIAIQRLTSNTTNDFLNLASTNAVTGGTIQIGNASTTGSPVIRVRSSVPVYNFTVNATGTPAAQLITTALTAVNNITIGTGATLNANNLNISLGGNWSNSGTFTPGSALVTFNGPTGTQTITRSGGETFNALTINKTTSGNVQLVDNITVNSTLTLTKALIDGFTNSKTITANGSAPTSGASTASYIYGSLLFNLPASATTSALLFPIGTSSIYAPVTITATTPAGVNGITASTATGTPSNENNPITNSSGINQSAKVGNYWTLTQVGTITNYTPTFTFTNTTNGGSSATYKLRNYTSSWADIAPTIAGTTIRSTAAITTFGDFEVGNANTITVATNPSNSSICTGSNTSFTASSTSSPAPSVKWQRSNGGIYVDITANLDAGTTYSNFTTGTLNLTGSTVGLNGYTYQAVFTNINGTATTTPPATLTVSPNVTAGTVSGTSPLCIGATDTYTSNGTPGGTWSSTNPLVATVNSSSGLVTAVASGLGTTDITYTVNSGCGSPVSSFKTLTVSPNVTAGTVSGTSPLCIGATDTYTSNGTPGGTWSSTNPLVATVNSSSGLVTAVASGLGTTDITYTVNSGCGSPVSSFKTLTVSPNVTAGTVSGTSPLCIGATDTYTSNGTPGGTWSSTNPLVATVNSSSGLVTAVASGLGTTDITYTVNSGCGSPVSSFKTLTVNPGVTAGTVSGTTPLCVGATDTYTSNGTSGGTWSSTDAGVATVNSSSGLVTAVSAGTTDITYTVNSGCGSPTSAFQTLTVNEAYTWTGLGLNDNFNNPANWSCNTLPTSNTNIDVVIPNGSNVILNTNYIVGSSGSFILQSTSTLTINPNITFTVTGTADFNGQHVTVASDINGTGSIGQIVGTLSDATNVTVERYIPANDKRAWRLLSVPTNTAQTIANSWQLSTRITDDAAGNGFDAVTPAPSMLEYNDGSNEWAGITSTANNIATGAGYFIYIRGDRSQLPNPGEIGSTNATTLSTTGGIFQKADAGLTRTITGSFGLVGNRFASAIDFEKVNDDGLSGSVNPNLFYVWDPKVLDQGESLGAYQAFISTNNWEPTYNGGSYAADQPNTRIESGLAFFVQGAGTVTLKEAHKVTGSNNVFRPSGTSSLVRLKTNLYTVSGATGKLADANVVVFDVAYSNAVDGKDAIKLSNTKENFGIRRDDKTLVVEGRQPITKDDTIFFDMWNMKPGTYKLEFTGDNLVLPGVTATLEDKYLHTFTPVNIATTSSVNFVVTNDALSYAKDRFRLVFDVEAPVPVLFTNVSASLKEDNNISVEWKVGGENGIQYYEIEHSVNGTNFVKTGKVAATGNNGGAAAYSFTDINSQSGDNFYRIRSISTSGEVKYSGIVKVSIGNLAPGFAIYPNPVADGHVSLQLQNQPKGTYGIRLMNAAGQVLMSRTTVHNGGSRTEQFIIPATISSGVYKLEINMPGNKTEVKKLIINK